MHRPRGCFNGSCGEEYVLQYFSREAHKPIECVQPLRMSANHSVSSLHAALNGGYVIICERVEALLEQDFVVRDVGVDQRELGLVLCVAQSRVDHLEARREARPARNHADLLGHVGAVVELALGTLDTDVVANLEQRNVTRDVTLLVRL